MGLSNGGGGVDCAAGGPRAWVRPPRGHADVHRLVAELKVEVSEAEELAPEALVGRQRVNPHRLAAKAGIGKVQRVGAVSRRGRTSMCVCSRHLCKLVSEQGVAIDVVPIF